MDNVWKNDDPRITIYKRANIVILRPSAQGHGLIESACASVEIHHGYNIMTDFKDGKTWFDEGSDWEPDWVWTFAPERKV